MSRLRRLPSSNKENQFPSVKPECGPDTLINAFENVLNYAPHSELNPEKLKPCQESLDFITQKLSVTPIQAIIIGMIIDYNGILSTEQMANFLDIRNIRMLTYMDELDELVSRRIIQYRECPGSNAFGYTIYPAVLRAYMQNKVYTLPCNRNLSVKRFVELTREAINERIADITEYKLLESDLEDLVKKNQRLPFCKQIKDMQAVNKVLFLFCCIKYIDEGDRNVNEFQMKGIFPFREFKNVFNSIKTGNNPLIAQELLTYGGGFGMNDKNFIGISDDLRDYFNTELSITWDAEDDNYKEGLKLYQDIVAKELFYNATEKEAIIKLTDLLQPDHFKEVQARLEECGMRKGFACLFHGAPGTGKTETVLQLARQTGRNIMQVNIASIKSKWVGDSEKNIKNIFNRYRNYCKRGEVTPILLFNEADAIINKRNENVNHSVDKMENSIQNIILEEMEQLEGILIATTNLTSNMDKAFERRFLYKIEFKKPLPEARSHIWRSMIKGLSADEASMLATEFDFSGGQIENIARKQIVSNILYNTPCSVDDIRNDCLAETLNGNKNRPIIGFK